MGACRDTFGKLAYTLTTKNGVFSVHKGENRIICHMPYYNTDAVLNIGLPMGATLPRFNSFIQAVRFMIENKEALR